MGSPRGGNESMTLEIKSSEFRPKVKGLNLRANDDNINEEDDDDVPQLVGNFEDAAKKWEWILIQHGWVNIESIESLTQSIELGNRIQKGCNCF